jgi:acyl-coenzyme A synthetase/AMP-(fatty) acid ligase/acyl carrier protein
VTHIQATPSGWRVLLAGGAAMPRVTAISGGEALTPDLAAELHGQARRVLNAYGPTETTIWTTIAEVSAAAPVTIGRPLANTRMYVLDDRMEPAPLGVPGELYVGGAGLARGYLHRPGLTAAAFVPDPFGPAGGRLYRTGDRGRLRPDGSVEFLGRRDDQVKLRGHRIELGEIEARLLAHRAVGQAAVLVSDGERGAELAAYLVPAGSAARAGLSDQDLRDHLAGTLPSIMVPRSFTWLAAFPLTPNGKADRKALPAAPRHRPAPSTGPGPAGGGHSRPVAETITRIWADILHIPDIGMDEDLFDLGGHSLTIVQIIARVRDRLGVDVPIDAFEDGATVESVTRVVTRLLDAP